MLRKLWNFLTGKAKKEKMNELLNLVQLLKKDFEEIKLLAEELRTLIKEENTKKIPYPPITNSNAVETTQDFSHRLPTSYFDNLVVIEGKNRQRKQKIAQSKATFNQFKRLRALFHISKVSQSKLAELYNCTQPTISLYLNKLDKNNIPFVSYEDYKILCNILQNIIDNKKEEAEKNK